MNTNAASVERLVEIRPQRWIAIDNYIQDHNPGPRVFLIHGTSGSPAHWRTILPSLAERFSCIVPTLLGHGSSKAPTFVLGQHNPYDFLEIAKDMEAVLKQFGDPNGNNIIIGHSRGAMIAAYLAYQHPDRVTKLILLCPDIYKNELSSSEVLWKTPVAQLESMRPQLEEAFRCMAFCDTTNPDLVAEEMAAARLVPMHVVQGLKLGKVKLPKLDFSKLLRPTLILVGDSDLIAPQSVVRAVYAPMPQHQIHLIQNAGHLLMLEQPASTLEHINRALKA